MRMQPKVIRILIHCQDTFNVTVKPDSAVSVAGMNHAHSSRNSYFGLGGLIVRLHLLRTFPYSTYYSSLLAEVGTHYDIQTFTDDVQYKAD